MYSRSSIKNPNTVCKIKSKENRDVTVHPRVNMNVTPDRQRKIEGIDNTIKMVQDRPEADVIAMAAKQMLALPQDMKETAWNRTLTAAAASGEEAHRRTSEEIKRLKQAPSRIAILESVRCDSGAPLATVVDQHGVAEIAVSAEIKADELVLGERVALSRNGSAVIGSRGFSPGYPTAEFEKLVEDPDKGCRIVMTMDGNRRLELSAGGTFEDRKSLNALEPGDRIAFEPNVQRALWVVERSSRVQEFMGEAADKRYGKDIGGLDDIWHEMCQKVIGPLTNPRLAKRLDMEPACGVLLYGPPGVGKTALVKAFAREILEVLDLDVNAPIIFRVHGATLLRPLVGQGEGLVMNIASAAERASEKYGFGLVLLDDFEYAVLRRGMGDLSTPAYSSLTSTILSRMQGLSDCGHRVTYVATTNRPDLCDSAALRASGRFGVKFEIPRPGITACKDILRVHLDGVPLAEDFESVAELMIQKVFSPSPDDALLRIAFSNSQHQDIFPRDIVTGAILEGVVDRAKSRAFDRGNSNGHDDAKVTLDDLMSSLNQELRSAVSAVGIGNVRDYYLNLPAGHRVDAVHHLYKSGAVVEEAFVT